MNPPGLPCPFATFFAVHFEVGSDSKNLGHQENCWSAAVDFVSFADRHNAKLTLQFNPQWAEYILSDEDRHEILKQWRERGHEISLHHHAYDHPDWNGYTNRPGIEKDSRYRGTVSSMMEIMNRLAYPGTLSSGTISDETSDYPECIKYDTEGVLIGHARRRPVKTVFGDREVLQFGMACMSYDGVIESFKEEYKKSDKNEVFGVITHETDLVRDPRIFEEWFGFVNSSGLCIRTVSEIAVDYLDEFDPAGTDDPLMFSRDVRPGGPGIRKRLKKIADRFSALMSG